jgi:hypothetical protein
MDSPPIYECLTHCVSNNPITDHHSHQVNPDIIIFLKVIHN